MDMLNRLSHLTRSRQHLRIKINTIHFQIRTQLRHSKMFGFRKILAVILSLPVRTLNQYYVSLLSHSNLYRSGKS